MTLQLGYRFDLEDRAALSADSRLYARLLSSGDWTYADPRPWTPTGWWHIRNQANMGSCRGHSLAANARLCGYLKAGKLDLDDDGTKNEPLEDDFSPMWCYLMSQRESGIRGDSGANDRWWRKSASNMAYVVKSPSLIHHAIPLRFLVGLLMMQLDSSLLAKRSLKRVTPKRFSIGLDLVKVHSTGARFGPCRL
jgi:hypothetical protein